MFLSFALLLLSQTLEKIFFYLSTAIDQAEGTVKYPWLKPRGFYAGCPTLASSKP